jgi:hypothetical protein
MLDNLYLLAAIIIILWLATLAYYFYTSRQQKDIQQEIEWLRDHLKEDEDQVTK